jgi:hypothetical protein
MAFDINTARPEGSDQPVKPGFNINTAKPEKELEDGFFGASVIEPALTIGSSMIAEPLAGAAGIVMSLLPGDEGAGAKAVEATRKARTYEPRTKEGAAGLQAVGNVLEPIGNAIQSTEKVLGDAGFAIAGPTGGAIGATIPTALMEALGLASLRGIRNGTRLIDDAGNPTKALESALDKKGLIFENLTEEARLAIPNVASPKLLPSPKSETLSKAEEALKEQLKSGARDDSLAALRLENGTIKADKLGQESIKQGFKPGFVQAVKTANRSTKIAMREMLTMMKRIKGNSRLGLDFRPTDVIGNELVKRIKFIRGKADSARLELNRIAERELSGLNIETGPVVEKFKQSLADLDITLNDGPRGKPIPEYKGSLISKDKTSQRVINDSIDLLSEGGKPDALRFHKLKRQLDTMIDFRKKSKDGLTEAGRNVLKDLRRSLNNALRDSNDGYAKVNDTLSQSLGSFESLQKAVGPSIDIFGDSSKASLGQDMRGLMSNRKTRNNLNDAVNEIDNTARNFGGNFSADIKDLALFANNLDNRFGPVAESGFKAEVASGVDLAGRAATQGASVAAVDAAVGGVKRGFEKMSGINDFNAFKSIDNILKRP